MHKCPEGVSLHRKQPASAFERIVIADGPEPDMTTAQGFLGVARLDGNYHAVATHPVAAGELIAELNGRISDRPSRYTIQLDDRHHLDLPENADLTDVMDRYAWRFLNHSCDANSAVRGRTLVAIRPIARLEEITFNYNTTEYDMAAPFT